MSTLTNPLVRWERYTPFHLGLEDTFARLDALADRGVSFPPYNLVRVSDTVTRLEVALAGYSREQLEVTTERGVLTVAANKLDDEVETGSYLHKGLARRTFARNWQLSDDTVVENVTYKDGLLTLDVRKEVPEEQRRKLLPIT